MTHKVRLGPAALFLTVIAAVLATLAMLTVATSRADTVLAQRFAEVTRIRYALEADGARFLQEADAFFEGREDTAPSAASEEDGALRTVIEKEGYELHIAVRGNPDGTMEVEEWKIVKLWEEEDPFEDIWPG